MMEDDFKHAPVLLEEVLNGLHIHQDGMYIDATFGRGGHSLAILEKLAANGRLLVFDKDPEAIALAKEIAQRDQRLEVCHSSFSQVSDFVAQHSLLGLVDGDTSRPRCFFAAAGQRGAWFQLYARRRA